MFTPFSSWITTQRTRFLSSRKNRIVFTLVAIDVIGLLSLLLFIVSLNAWVVRSTADQIHKSDTLPKTYQVGIVLGAKVYPDGGLSGMTKDRTDRAIQLYESGKVERLLVSGDHGTKGYDEVNSMKDYLLKAGVPAEDIFLDHAGFDTYDSIYRARDIFEVQSAVIITQEFHLPRALFIANSLKLEAVGVPADIQNYGHMERVLLREKLAVVKAWGNVMLGSAPQFLGEKIPITGESKMSWDKDL